MGAGALSPLPQTCAIAFKEWASVCDALARGDQSLILRKGGVSETDGPGRFLPEHPAFWLYPTWVHQAEQGVRTNTDDSPPIHQPYPQAKVPIHVFACVKPLYYLKDEQTLNLLEPFHILTAETVQKRFHYRTPGLWVLAVRAWARSEPEWIALKPEHDGCKTWISLDHPLSTAGFLPAIDDTEWSSLQERWQSLLPSESASSHSRSSNV
jgi:hypothetical protein